MGVPYPSISQFDGTAMSSQPSTSYVGLWKSLGRSWGDFAQWNFQSPFSSIYRDDSVRSQGLAYVGSAFISAMSAKGMKVAEAGSLFIPITAWFSQSLLLLVLAGSGFTVRLDISTVQRWNGDDDAVTWISGSPNWGASVDERHNRFPVPWKE